MIAWLTTLLSSILVPLIEDATKGLITAIAALTEEIRASNNAKLINQVIQTDAPAATSTAEFQAVAAEMQKVQKNQ